MCHATLVLRVKLHRQAAGIAGQYGWDEAVVIKVLRNKTNLVIGKTIGVAWTVGKAGGLPQEECTIYLEPFGVHSVGPDRTWRLLYDGDAVLGCSHVTPAPKPQGN